MGKQSKAVVFAYLALTSLFTLGASVIWAINTIFLLRVGGLNLFETMLVNTAFTLSQMTFEVPTGVIADTIGRRASILLSLFTLTLSTLLYVLTPMAGWGFWGFVVASVLLGLGYTFQTGATDAWLVDALDASGWERPKDRVFAWGQIGLGAGMLVGSLLGGILGQIDLKIPYLVRAGLIAVCFVVAYVLVKDLGFEPRELKMSTFGAEARKIFDAGLEFGWHSPVVRPMLWVSALGGLFSMYGFYAWQPYVLELLGRDYVWLLGVVQAASSGAGIVGNTMVGRFMGEGEHRRDPAVVLFWAAAASSVLVLAIGAIGMVFDQPGVLPAAFAIALWLVWGVAYGVTYPIRMSYLNENIPSSQRATVLSLDAFFLDGGGAVGQPTLGWVSDRFSISIAWLIGGSAIAFSARLYRASGAAATRLKARAGISPES